MSSRTIEVELPQSIRDSAIQHQVVSQVVDDQRDRLAEAASTWARLHYDHASYVEDSLTVRTVELNSDGVGKVTMDFDWTMRDGCSDLTRDGSGFVEFGLRVTDCTLELEWSVPEKPSTADEF